jgi:hypothetical protein
MFSTSKIASILSERRRVVIILQFRTLSANRLQYLRPPAQ